MRVRAKLIGVWGLVFLYVAIVAIIMLYMLWEKSEPHPMNEQFITAHYRGFGFINYDSLLGKRYTAITQNGMEVGGYWRFETPAAGYQPFMGYYPDGTLREEGAAMIEYMGLDTLPYHDSHDVKWSKCYRPDGSLGSEVVDGTGIQTIWYPDGTLRWELELRDGERVHLKMYRTNGELLTEHFHVDDFSIDAVDYYEDGSKRSEGRMVNFKRVGVWIDYDAEGNATTTDEGDAK